MPTPVPTPTPTPAPIDAPSVLWWKCKDGTGTALNASAGSAGATNGTWTYQSGLGYAVCLNGAGQYVTSKSQVAFNTKVVTVELWLNCSAFSSNGTTQTLVETADPNSHSGAISIYASWGYTYVKLSDSGYNLLVGHIANASSAAWHHFAFVIDNSTGAGAIKAYVDGVAKTIAFDTRAKALPGNLTALPIYLGSRAGTQNFTPCKLTDVRIYNCERAPAQIVSDMKSPAGLK